MWKVSDLCNKTLNVCFRKCDCFIFLILFLFVPSVSLYVSRTHGIYEFKRLRKDTKGNKKSRIYIRIERKRNEKSNRTPNI